MKLSRGLALLLATIVPVAANETESSSSLSSVLTQVPACSEKCFHDALSQTTCDSKDEKCICSDQALFTNVTACVLKSCTSKEALSECPSYCENLANPDTQAIAGKSKSELTLSKAVRNLTAVGCKEPVRNRNTSYIILSDTLGIISGVFILQRFAFKLWTKRAIGWDDWTALATIVCGAPSTVLNAYGMGPNGIGRDSWTLSFEQLYNFGRFFYVEQFLYYWQIAMVKLAMLAFFLPIFPGRTVRRVLWGTIAFTVLYGLVFLGVTIFTCSPISYFWTRWNQEHTGTCMDINMIAWSNAGIGIAIDFWMLAIPLWQLKGLNMHWKKKVGVAAMFVLGTFVTIVSILRLRAILQFGSESMNPTWDYVELTTWSCIELNVGIWCMCLPSLRLMLVRMFPSLGGSSARSYAMYGSSVNRTVEKSSRGRGMGPTATVTSSFHERPARNPGNNQIAYYKSYTVEVSDADEVALVSLGDEESRTRISSSRSRGSV